MCVGSVSQSFRRSKLVPLENPIPPAALTQSPTIQQVATAHDGATMLDQAPLYERVKPRLNPPLEITRDMLCLMSVVDENVVITRAQIQQDVD